MYGFEDFICDAFDMMCLSKVMVNYDPKIFYLNCFFTVGYGVSILPPPGDEGRGETQHVTTSATNLAPVSIELWLFQLF